MKLVHLKNPTNISANQKKRRKYRHGGDHGELIIPGPLLSSWLISSFGPKKTI